MTYKLTNVFQKTRFQKQEGLLELHCGGDRFEMKQRLLLSLRYHLVNNAANILDACLLTIL